MSKTATTPLEYIFQETKIHFLLENEENVMVNATEMAKIIKRRTKDFLKTEQTKVFTEALKRALNGAQIIDDRGRNGIYFERRLALKFAAWLDPDFELWVFSKIDEILFGKYKEHKEAALARIEAEKVLKTKKEEYLIKYPEFEEFLMLEGKVSEAEKRQSRASRAMNAQYKMNF